MAYKDYSPVPASNTVLGDGTYVGANMLRNKVRPAIQQLAADGRELYDELIARTSGLEAALVSVKNYGATGNGSVIDVAAINRAIRACSAGQTLFFPAGSYLIDGSDLQTVDGIGQVHTVPLPVGVNVLMEGGAWLKRAPSDTGGPIFFTPRGNNIIQANIDGDEYPLTGGMAGTWRSDGGVGIYAVNASNVTLKDCRIRNIEYGVNATGIAHWRIQGGEITRTRLSGIILTGNDTTGCAHNQVHDVYFEDMGDTAVAFHYLTNTSIVAHNDVFDCHAKNTQMRVDGYAFDVEAAPTATTHYRNTFSRLTVEQVTVSGFVQGGATMNANVSDSAIVDCTLRGNGAASGIGIAITQSRDVEVRGNKIQNFRANAIYADGAVRPTIAGNKINDCGNLTNVVNSTILLAYELGSTAPVVQGNRVTFSSGYAGSGNNGAAVFARYFSGFTAENAVVRDNILDTSAGTAISLYGFSGAALVGNVYVEGNHVTGPSIIAPIQVMWNSGGRVQGNRLNNVAHVPVFTNAHASTLIRDNDGYKTEAWGTSAVIATGGTIPHGLAVVPTSFRATPTSAGTADVWVTADATHLTVNFGGGVTIPFTWEARA